MFVPTFINCFLVDRRLFIDSGTLCSIEGGWLNSTWTYLGILLDLLYGECLPVKRLSCASKKLTYATSLKLLHDLFIFALEGGPLNYLTAFSLFYSHTSLNHDTLAFLHNRQRFTNCFTSKSFYMDCDCRTQILGVFYM